MSETVHEKGRHELDWDVVYETPDFTIERHREAWRRPSLVIRNRKNPKLAIELESGNDQEKVLVMGHDCSLQITQVHDLVGPGAHDVYTPAVEVVD